MLPRSRVFPKIHPNWNRPSLSPACFLFLKSPKQTSPVRFISLNADTSAISSNSKRRIGGIVKRKRRIEWIYLDLVAFLFQPQISQRGLFGPFSAIIQSKPRADVRNKKKKKQLQGCLWTGPEPRDSIKASIFHGESYLGDFNIAKYYFSKSLSALKWAGNGKERKPHESRIFDSKTGIFQL